MLKQAMQQPKVLGILLAERRHLRHLREEQHLREDQHPQGEQPHLLAVQRQHLRQQERHRRLEVVAE